jgi:alpha-amylase
MDELKWYIGETYGQIALFDFPLQRKLVDASRRRSAFDMSSLSWGTLSAEVPVLSVPFVHSHDDQPPVDGHSDRGEYVGNVFISQAYAMVLLRDVGYPMVNEIDLRNHPNLIKRMTLARAHCTYGSRHDRFDHGNTVGWSFSGGEGFDNSMAVVMTNGTFGTKWLPTGRPGVRYRDLLDGLTHTVTTNGEGWAEFSCPNEWTSVWVETTKYEQVKGLADAAG